MTDTCLICGEPVPKGRQVCPNCEKGLKPWKELSKTEVYRVKMKHYKGCEYLDHQEYCAYFDIEGHVRGCRPELCKKAGIYKKKSRKRDRWSYE